MGSNYILCNSLSKPLDLSKSNGKKNAPMVKKMH